MANTPTQSMHIGGNAAGVVQILGNDNRVSATGGVSGTPPEVMAALAAIQAALSANPSTKALTALAVESAKAAPPDKPTIGGHLQSALALAKVAPGLTDAVAKLGPPVHTVAGWLGDAWTSLGG